MSGVIKQLTSAREEEKKNKDTDGESDSSLRLSQGFETNPEMQTVNNSRLNPTAHLHSNPTHKSNTFRFIHHYKS